jgi:hypothetical protein
MREPVAPESRGRVVTINVLLVLAFVAFAVLELLRTWNGADRIADHLLAADTHSEVAADNTAQIAQLQTTVARTAAIAAGARPIGAKVARINAAATDIRLHADRIADDAAAIDAAAHTIDTRVSAINSAAAAILATAGAINGDVTGISDSAADISARFAQLLPVVRHIYDGPMPYGVTNIDRNTDSVITLARQIVGDLGDLTRLVPQIDAHARSICAAPLIRGPGCAAEAPG